MQSDRRENPPASYAPPSVQTGREEMQGDLVMVNASWDSGPYATYWRSEQTVERPGGKHGFDTCVLVPREVLERYERAYAEHDSAEQALEKAVDSAVERLRQARNN